MVKKRKKNQMRLLQLLICADHWFQDVVHLVAFFKFFFTKDSNFYSVFTREGKKEMGFYFAYVSFILLSISYNFMIIMIYQIYTNAYYL